MVVVLDEEGGVHGPMHLAFIVTTLSPQPDLRGPPGGSLKAAALIQGGEWLLSLSQEGEKCHWNSEEARTLPTQDKLGKALWWRWPVIGAL